jgi:acetyl/propionyl-CoA carboxylase alpha subunit
VKSRRPGASPVAATVSLRKDSRPPSKLPGAAPFRRVLVANRGEIALRIIRACHDLGMEAVAVFSDADAGASHVRAADAAVRLGPAPAAESYLRGDAIIEAALRTGAEAIHPGYGFLAERASFARAVEEAGLAFVGPSSEAIAAVGDKLAARRLARAAGVPVVPGTLEQAAVDRPDAVAAILAEADAIGFPLFVKASSGGGGRGMRRVTTRQELPAALAAGSAEALAAFGDGAVYLEREVRPARHVEVQLLGDAAGTIVALGERDCSIQRRHQKLVEESPAPGLTATERAELHDLAVRVARAAGLTNAATAEFLFDEDRRFWFLEVNTRLQVEHGVTELTCGIDLVREQLLIAAGRPLSEATLAAAVRAAAPGLHAIEVRLSAEDPARSFGPVAGRIGRWSMPAGPGVRVDTAIEAGDRIPPDYDSLIAKLMVVDVDRDAAIRRLGRVLDEVEVTGIQTTLPFHRFLAGHPTFQTAELSTDWVADVWEPAMEAERAAALAIASTVAAAAVGSGSFLGDSMGTGPLVAPPPNFESGWLRAGREADIDRWPPR